MPPGPRSSNDPSAISTPADSLSVAKSAVEIADGSPSKVTGARRNGVTSLDVLDGLQSATSVVVDHAAGAVDEEVGAAQLVDLLDGEVLDARAGHRHERHEVDADEQCVGRGGGALRVARRVVGGEASLEAEQGRDGPETPC